MTASEAQSPYLPFLLLTTRPEELVAQEEYESFRNWMGLSDDELVQIRVDNEPERAQAVNLDDYSGVVLGGGPFNYSDEEKSDIQLRCESDIAAILDAAADRDFPVFGACYGVGIIGTHTGGTVSKKYGESPGAIQVTVTEDGRRDPLLEGLPEKFHVIVGHKEACEILPPGATLLITGENCPVQMFRYARNVYVTQFHPELTLETFSQRLKIYRDAGYYAPEDYQRIYDQASAHAIDIDNRLLRNFKKRYQRAAQ